MNDAQEDAPMGVADVIALFVFYGTIGSIALAYIVGHVWPMLAALVAIGLAMAGNSWRARA